MLKHQIYAATATILLCLASCQKEEITPPPPQMGEQEAIERLVCAGFRSDDIKIIDNYAVIENEICIDLDKFNSVSQSDNSINSGKTESWIINSEESVRISGQSPNFYYYIEPDMSKLEEGNEWITAIILAAQQWTDISGCRVSFIQTTVKANANLIFYPVLGLYYNGTSYVPAPYDIDRNISNFPELPSCAKNMRCEDGYYASAAFPVGQNIGSWIAITTCFPGELTLAQKTVVATHEIGHALGFRHASYGCLPAQYDEDEYEYQCPDSPILGANLLWGTPMCDFNSLMTKSNKDNTFNAYDLQAARMVFPEGTPPYLEYVLMSNKIGNTNCRLFTAKVINTLPWYQLKLKMINASTNLLVKESNIVLGSSSHISIQFCGSGNYKFHIWGISYDGIRMITSNTYSVNIP